MSYAGAAALQGAVYTRLKNDPAVTAHVGGNVLDAAPVGAVPDLYVSLGEEEVRWRGDTGGGLAEHRFAISVFAAEASFATGKAVAAAVETALSGSPLALATGRVVLLALRSVRARRARGQARRQIEMIFRAVLDEI